MSFPSLTTESEIESFLDQVLSEQHQMKNYALSWVDSIEDHQMANQIHPQSASLYSISPSPFYLTAPELNKSELNQSNSKNESLSYKKNFPLFDHLMSNLTFSQREHHIDHIRIESKMLGLLLIQRGKDRFLLRAFSGQVNQRWTYPNWAPPLFDESAFAYESWLTQLQLHHLTRLIQNPSQDLTSSEILDPSSFSSQDITKELKALRKKKSRQLTRKIHQNYHFHLPNQKQISLFELWPKAPTGTGECCAPKLLSWCYKLNAKPLGLVEFWWDAQRSMGDPLTFHLPCLQRCAPLLPSFFST